MGINSYDEQVGLQYRGSIYSYDSSSGTMEVSLSNTSAIIANQKRVTVSAPFPWFSPNGIFAGSAPSFGMPVIVAQGLGGQYHFSSFVVEDAQQIPEVNENQFLIQANDDTKITLDKSYDIIAGSSEDHIHLQTKEKYFINSFDYQGELSKAHRSFTGVIKRDLKPNTNTSAQKLYNDEYFSYYSTVALDPTTSPSLKNPPLVESREVIYEVFYDPSRTSEANQSARLTSKPNDPIYTYPNRKESRGDTLSLSLEFPNELLEITKGTVVDAFGNLLDINRYPLRIGQDQTTLNPSKSTNLSASFDLIKETERKSIGFHFELNARKDPKSRKPITVSENYARDRSRFFLDIDKEGQIKLNVPASSERGNVSLLSRYEPYSLIGDEDNNNPNKLIFREDNLDLLHDGFAAKKFDRTTGMYSTEAGSIFVKDGEAEISPIDRLTSKHLKGGTAFHDVLATCYANQNNDFLKYQNIDIIDLSQISVIEKVMTDTIFVSGDKANAGGRSGNFSFDGSLEFSIGANTSDRQSLIMDLAGGYVSNIGRDRYGRSVTASLNGDFICQIGGMGVKGDSRFETLENGQKGAIMELRVFTDGLYVHLIRLDKNGVTVMTPGNMQFHAKGDMKFSSDTAIQLEAEEVIIQNRTVNKQSGGSI